MSNHHGIPFTDGSTGNVALEKALADALVDVASDLRLVPAEDFIAFVRTDQAANIAAIVSSSAELYFKPGTLRYARACEAAASWDGNPVISIAMEFSHQPVWACFRLILEARHASVQLDYLSIDAADAHTGAAAHLVAALQAARLPSAKTAPEPLHAGQVETSPVR